MTAVRATGTSEVDGQAVVPATPEQVALLLSGALKEDRRDDA